MLRAGYYFVREPGKGRERGAQRDEAKLSLVDFSKYTACLRQAYQYREVCRMLRCP